MSKGAVVFNEQKVEYYTPKEIVEMFGLFDYDPFTTLDGSKKKFQCCLVMSKDFKERYFKHG